MPTPTEYKHKHPFPQHCRELIGSFYWNLSADEGYHGSTLKRILSSADPCFHMKTNHQDRECLVKLRAYVEETTSGPLSRAFRSMSVAPRACPYCPLRLLSPAQSPGFPCVAPLEQEKPELNN